MMPLRRTPRKPPAENVIPLINVVFLLLVFFMLAGRLGPTDPFEIQVPTAQADRPADDPDRTLFVAADGELAFRGHRTGLAQLPSLLAAPGGAPGVGTVQIKADRNADAALIVDLLARLGGLGITDVVLLTDPTPGDSP